MDKREESTTWDATAEHYASVISRSRRTVLQAPLTDVLQLMPVDTHLRTVAAAVVETVHAPPAMTFLQELHFQIPTAWRLTESCVRFRH